MKINFLVWLNPFGEVLVVGLFLASKGCGSASYGGKVHKWVNNCRSGHLFAPGHLYYFHSGLTIQADAE